MAISLDDLHEVCTRLMDPTIVLGAENLTQASSSVWIASGLAKIAAAYGSSMAEQLAGQPSKAMTALDYCYKHALRSLPVLVSLKGRHEDAQSVAQSISNRGAERAILITGDPKGPAAKKLKDGNTPHDVVTSEFPERDTRFVNCRSVFMLSALVYRLVQQAFPEQVKKIDGNELTQLFARATHQADLLSRKITSINDWKNKQIIVLGQGLHSDLTISWQSILSESSITTPTVLDLKDYTHGDHLAVVRSNNTAFLLIQQPGNEHLCKTFEDRFSTRFPVLTATLNCTGPTLFWENLFLCCATVSALTVDLGYAGLRPPRDPIVHAWRGWGAI